MNPDLLRAALTAPSYPRVRRRVLRQLFESLLYEEAIDQGVNGTLIGANGVRYTYTARRRETFGRVTVDELLRDGEEPTSVGLLLSELAEHIDADPEHLARFARELEETLLKDAVAHHLRDGNAAKADHDALESLVIDGHRYHPAYKSRIGFDLVDNLAYGPEFAQPIRPLWLAVSRDIAEVSGSRDVEESEFLRAQLGSAFGSLPDEAHTLLPVHPWQWREHVCRTYAEQLRTGELVVLGEDPDTFTAQQSIRTLSCVDNPDRPYLKLAMSLVNTSTSRVLAPHTVHNAPLISDWLYELVSADPVLRDEWRPVLLRELLGTVVTADMGLLHEDGYGTLGCVWRESLHPRLDPGERAAPFTALTARAADGSPLIDGWVSEHGLDRWLRRLTEVAVLPLVRLLCEHGVALEAHAQNMVLLHRAGLPTRVALRDFHDGVRFSRAHLAQPGRCPTLRATPAHHGNRNSFVETDDPDLVADFLLDAFCFVNLGELAMFLAEAYGLAEGDFWAVVRGCLRTYRERFPAAVFDLHKPTVSVEKLTTRRLLPDTELRLHPAPNPLAHHD
ncbi:siderophore synthetase component [Saccharomonospora marina XMU15]|uniref:Siderophore synthetase component n=1 Tax=Saccharomonospora marina XMU15 TaxID=882083 RepID=H5X048_9PSEU|nr:IucA/IucC family protein [Saccharomonospora marina]EHR53044.1 siderophore synthetase component [Saccharomonospora marina XMU15]